MNTTTHHITDCDYCGAAAGTPCTTASGRPAVKPHAAREKAADAIRTEQPEAVATAEALWPAPMLSAPHAAPGAAAEEARAEQPEAVADAHDRLDVSPAEARWARTSEPFGYVCKSCGGPSPVGVGYAAPGAAAEEASADLDACACGYSVRPVADAEYLPGTAPAGHPEHATEDTTEDQHLIDGIAASDEFTTPDEVFGPNWNTPAPTHGTDALLAHLNTLVPARTDEDVAAADAAARAESAAFWTPERVAEHDKVMAEHEAVTATREALAEFRNTACTRCGGSGTLPQFVPVNGGECFTCDGTGKR